MKKKLPVKPWDIVIILLALSLTGFSAFRIYLKPQNMAMVTIEGQDKRWVFPLDAEETIPVAGPLGNTVVRIHGNEAWVESSPCENQICVQAGHLSGNFEFAACLPNNVLLLVEGPNDSKNTVDRTAR